MYCPDCKSETGRDGFCPTCAAASNTRPTIIGLPAAGPGFFCRQCGTHNSGAWGSCAACGAPAPGLNHAAAWMAGLLIGLIAALAGVTAWRLSQPPVVIGTPAVYEVAPVPTEQANIVIRSSVFTPGQDHWQMTAITQSGGVTEITRSGGSTVVVSQDQNGSVTTQVQPPVIQSQTEIVSSSPVQGVTINQ
ncbi:MAG: hypothetical protein LC772_09615 [Chloroflexi bacterium]|nr:hypothetical protein [Chloroflexota bacterium]